MAKLIRSEAHRLSTSPDVQAAVARTISAYRTAVRAIATLVMTHWPEIASAPSKCFAVEALFHATAKRPTTKYRMVSRMLGKMPSYLRRAAIEAAYGVVSSYLSNYSNWLDDTERERGAACFAKLKPIVHEHTRLNPSVLFSLRVRRAK